jgi:hypothetical protein
MTQIINNGSLPIVGCMDPMASNYDPNATVQPQDICVYNTQVVGCTDPLAANYNPLANVSCNNCCTYTQVDTLPTLGGGEIISIGFGTVNDVLCPGPFSITMDNEVLGVTSTECCNTLTIGNPPPGYEYYWQPGGFQAQGGKCILRATCPTDLTCVDCTNFDWWNDTYILNHGGQGLQTTSPILWQQLVSLVANSGQTFYVQTSTGNLLDEVCCGSAKGTFRDGVCFCETPVNETFEPRCISNINDFITFVSTTEGYNYFVANSSSLAGALDLTNQQMTFIVNNFFNTNDSNGNGVPDMTEARLLMSNALGITGGFYVNFGTVTNTPTGLNKGICDSIGGYWDTVPGQCMCQPLVDQCDIDITMVQTTTTTDFYGNTIQIVTQNGTPISEPCCNRLIKDYNLPWVWQGQRCYATPKEDCLPVIFTLNDKPMNVPACGNDLELSMWVYFGKPENPCQPIPDPPGDDTIVIDGVVCDITLTPNTGQIENPTHNQRDIKQEVSQPILQPSSTCCYSIFNPILGRIITTDPQLNNSLTQVKEFNSGTDFFERWIQLKATLPTSGLTLNFGVTFEVYQGLNCCCEYEFHIDDIQVDCVREESSLIVNDISCPGFELTKVIDNKKSWVYNPGIASIGTSEYDNIERGDGSFGLLNGEGNVNRTFAPSLDAELPWRYTDYWNQSSVLERHSSLVLNSKELGLTFDMCADCPITGTTLGCPDGFLLSGNTGVCYKEDTFNCVDDNLLTNSTFNTDLSDWGVTPVGDWIWSSFSGGTALYTGADEGGYLQQDILLPGVSYDISFDLYWTFATPPCDSTNNYVQVYAGSTASSHIFTSGFTKVSLTLVADDVTFAIYAIDACSPTGTIYVDNICVIPTFPTLTFTGSTIVPTVTYLSLLNLETYKKTFQSFWIPFMEQFIPATTIWVAGERWCNEPCTIIDPCDYDFELTDAEISIQPVPNGFFPGNPRSVGGVAVPTTLSSTVAASNTLPVGGVLTSTPNILTITDIGLTNVTPNIPTENMVNVDLQAYRSRFTAPITEIITI